MLIKSEGKNLRPVKCFIREEKESGSGAKQDQSEVELEVEALDCEGEKSSGNPFLPGGPISEDGALILSLWRLDRLGQYGNKCQQEGEKIPSINPSQQQTSGGDETTGRCNATPAAVPTLHQKKEKIKSLCCFPA